LPPEYYLEWIDQTPMTRPLQMIMLISVNYKMALELQELLLKASNQMNRDVRFSIMDQISKLTSDIHIFKANIEN